MEHDKLMMIKELMDQLVEEMEFGKEDFDERLGKGKKMELIKVESPELEQEEEMMGEDLDGDMEMGEDPEHVEKVMGPEESLKERILKLRK